MLLIMSFIMAILLPGASRAARILFFNGLGEGSHFTSAAEIARELVSRNHSVTFLISNAYLHRTEDELYSELFDFLVFNHSLPVESVPDRMIGMTEAAFEDRLFSYVMTEMSRKVEEAVQDCVDVLGNEELMSRILESEYDLTFYDPIWPCSAILADIVGPTYIAISPHSFLAAHYRTFGGPINPALTPEMGSGLPMKMSFSQRLKNTAWAWLDDVLIGLFADAPYRGLDCVPDEQKKKGVAGVMRDTSLWFINSDPTIDMPVPLMPNIISVPGITTKAANPLSQELESFVQASGDHGVILFSLGGYISHMPKEKLDIFMGAFKKLKQNVIWQWKGQHPPENLPPNIRTMKWIPQNDLLGHNKTKLFIYQGGNNGLYEAIYHAVPLLVLPLIADQSDVAQRVKERGIGKRLAVSSLTSQHLLESINEVIETPSYVQNVELFSKIFRDKPLTSPQVAAFWVEHILKYGASHLRSPAHDLGFIQLYLLDVYLAMSLLVTVIVFIGFRTTRFVIRVCISCCKRSKKKRE